MCDDDDDRYFENPTFVHVTKEGTISLEWIHGPQGSLEQKRLSIYVDSEDHEHSGPLEIYAIATGPGLQQDITYLKTPQDIIKVLRIYFRS